MTKDQFQHFVKMLRERDIASAEATWAELVEHDAILARLITLEISAIKATVDYINRKLEK